MRLPLASTVAVIRTVVPFTLLIKIGPPGEPASSPATEAEINFSKSLAVYVPSMTSVHGLAALPASLSFSPIVPATLYCVAKALQTAADSDCGLSSVNGVMSPDSTPMARGVALRLQVMGALP